MNIEELNLKEKELDELYKELSKRKYNKSIQKNVNKILEHKKYIGKCYKEKEKEKYLCVLSPKSSNPFRMETICFEFPINFFEFPVSFPESISSISLNGIFSEIDFEGIYIEDYPFFCNDNDCQTEKTQQKIISSLIEISKEEYFLKMNEYIKLLQEKIESGDFDTSKVLQERIELGDFDTSK